MLGGNGFVRAALIKIDGRLRRQFRTEVWLRLDVVARPAFLADERHRNQENASRRPLGRFFGEAMDEDRRADRMADEYRSVIQLVELLAERRLPARKFGIIFVWHARIANLVIGPELPL